MVPFKKPSRRKGADACLQARPTVDGLAELRSGSEDYGHSIFATREDWLAFIEGVKAGEFDDVVPQGLPESPAMDLVS